MPNLKQESHEKLKLNLGCGNDLLSGFVNVDKFGTPDLILDLETFPWPWEENSVERVLLKHALEHMGESTGTYLDVIKELYRVCCHDAVIEIIVPHPRHDDFLNDPTHVRVVTPSGLSLFSKKLNHEWTKNRCSNTNLGLYLDIDLDIIGVHYVFDPVWEGILKDKDDVFKDQLSKRYNNVIRESHILLKVVKPANE